MPSSRKTFRVFISSTFTDMQAERRVLQGKVFPELKKYCEARGASFQAVDLRWGVNEESQREQKTMEICLAEIARCQRLSPRPNFIVLLGHRYGWQPVPNKIPSSEMAGLWAYLNDKEAKLIAKWYQEDTNALSPEYVLQPRWEEYRDYDQWQAVEDSLRSILRKAVAQTEFTAEQRSKYFDSATHLEIINGVLQTPDSGIDSADHVFAYLRELDPPPCGERADGFLDLMPDGTADPYAKAQLDGLKQVLIKKLPQDHIYRYLAHWHNGAQFDEGVLEAFATRVFRDLISIIDQELQQITAVDELTREKKNQEDFAQRLTTFFTGQAEPLRRIAAYIEGGSNKPLALLGPSGSGKSSLIAKAIENAREMAAEKFSRVIIYRFIDATSSSSNSLLWLEEVCAEIARAYGTSLKDLAYEGQREIFPRCLALATEDKPLLLFIDALDQLQSERFDFLDIILPQHVRIILSALSDLEDRLTFTEVYRVPPMPEPDGSTLLAKWLAAEGRTLTLEQRQAVISKFGQNGLPLYLKLAFEQARQWRSYDIGKILPANIDGILADYFDLLEKEHTSALVGKVTGYLLSGKYQGLTESEILDLLVFDREYWESFVQGSHPAHRKEIEELQKLPMVVWSRLFLDLEPYLKEKDADGLSIISFYHRKFWEYGVERYLGLITVEPISPKCAPSPLYETKGLQEGAGGDLARGFHAALASYFESLPLYLDDLEQAPNIRRVVEQPYQETMAGRWEALADQSLGHFPFLMAKARAAMVDGILEDYVLAFKKLPPEKIEKLRLWQAFFRERAHIMRRGNNKWPVYKILLQLAIEHADDSPVTQGAERYLVSGKVTWCWLRRDYRLKHVNIDPCLAILEGHTGKINGAKVLPNGHILSWSDDHTLRLWNQAGKPVAILEGHTGGVRVLELSDGRILSWSSDATLRLWNQAGKPVAILEGHAGGVRGVLELSDGLILSWSDDVTLRLWDRDGKPLAIFRGHDSIIKGVLELPDGRILSWSLDKTLRLWDRDGKPLAILKGHNGDITDVKVLRDGRILSWSSYSEDETIRLWDQKGKPLSIIRHFNKMVDQISKFLFYASYFLGCYFYKFPSGRDINPVMLLDGRILSWSENKKYLRLWDRDGKPLTVLKGHRKSITNVLELTDGRILSMSKDHTLRLWDREGKPLAILKGHKNRLGISALELPNGRILSWSDDATLRLWDQDGKPLAVLEGHTHWYIRALGLPDGRILSWSDDATLRLWDRDGKELAILKGYCITALLLPDSRILSWSSTLRLWDLDGNPLAVFEGHSKRVSGVCLMAEGRILSYSEDGTLRIWSQGGKQNSALEGHVAEIREACALPDGHILSWSVDGTLRLWDLDGKPLAVVEPHTFWINGAFTISDEQKLSWSGDAALRLWDRDGSVRLDLPDGRILSLLPHDNTISLLDKDGELLEKYMFGGVMRIIGTDYKSSYGSCLYGNSYLTQMANSVILAGSHRSNIVWNGGSKCSAQLLIPDGRAVVTQANGQVCVLQLYHGNRLLTLDELEAIETAEYSSHPAVGLPGIG